jgi:hypothetical protein
LVIKLKRKKINKKKKTKTILSKIIELKVLAVNEPNIKVTVSTQKKRIKVPIKMIGLDLFKKLANIISFVIFAV